MQIISVKNCNTAWLWYAQNNFRLVSRRLTILWPISARVKWPMRNTLAISLYLQSTAKSSFLLGRIAIKCYDICNVTLHFKTCTLISCARVTSMFIVSETRSSCKTSANRYRRDYHVSNLTCHDNTEARLGGFLGKHSCSVKALLNRVMHTWYIPRTMHAYIYILNCV